MVTELNNQNLGANKPDSMFCSFLEHRKLSLRLSDGACHFSESPCNPCSAGTTLDVVLSFLFNLTWLVPPWRMTWEKYNLSNVALGVFSTPLAVCVCEWGARSRLSFSWLWFKEMNARSKRDECKIQTHWGGGFQWWRSLLFVGETHIWQSQLWTTSWKLINILELAVWILNTVEFLLPALRC